MCRSVYCLKYYKKRKRVSAMKKAILLTIVLFLIVSTIVFAGGERFKRTVKVNEEMVVCPVMKTEFPKDQTYSVVEYRGKKYYMCCAGCEPAFKKDPEKYLK
jgi:YHS domain-containing protein